MASEMSQKGKDEILKQNLNLVTEANLKLVLVDSGFSFDKTVDFVDDGTADDVASHEISVTGYTPGFGGAGRRVPSSRAFNRDDPEGKIKFDFDDEVWSNLGAGVTIGGVVLIVEKTNDSDSWVVAFDDLDSNIPTNGGNVTYSPATEGLIEV